MAINRRDCCYFFLGLGALGLFAAGVLLDNKTGRDDHLFGGGGMVAGIVSLGILLYCYFNPSNNRHSASAGGSQWGLLCCLGARASRNSGKEEDPLLSDHTSVP